jgi:hypothetical protein
MEKLRLVVWPTQTKGYSACSEQVDGRDIFRFFSANGQHELPILQIALFEHSHIYYILGGNMSFPDLVDCVRRHASQIGKAFRAAHHFHG